MSGVNTLDTTIYDRAGTLLDDVVWYVGGLVRLFVGFLSGLAHSAAQSAARRDPPAFEPLNRLGSMGIPPHLRLFSSTNSEYLEDIPS